MIFFLCLCLTFLFSFKHTLIHEFCTHLINYESDLEFVVVYNPRLVLKGFTDPHSFAPLTFIL